MSVHEISNKPFLLTDLAQVVSKKKSVVLSDDATARIERCRAYLDAKMETSSAPIYGINTGFGSLCNTSISNEDLGQLQTNLVMSHACGTGDEVPRDIVKLMLLLKVQGLSYGNSGAQLITVQRLIDFYNNDVQPIIFQQGSLGASGDLAPLAHMALALLGMGECHFKGERMPAAKMLEQNGWEPIQLQSKEGLALLNGTQFMSAYGVWCVLNLQRLSTLADILGAISLDAFDGRIEPFHDLIHLVRAHSGQLQTAQRIRKVLDGSAILARTKVHVQDPYSFRCMPQVHGASKDTLAYVQTVFETEINSVTDNPTVFIEEDLVISAGNFHGQPLALVLDFMAIAAAEWGSISERRVYQLISGTRGLPPFLVANPGLNSGFMIPQYTAASIVSQNKQLASPSSIDSIESSNGQEDHVSMGANAATKLFRVVENLERILAIELFNGAQAIEFREEKSSQFVQDFLAEYRKTVAFIDDDKIMHDEIMKSIQFIRNVDSAVLKAV
jgi:histidine ammonia-lyase